MGDEGKRVMDVPGSDVNYILLTLNHRTSSIFWRKKLKCLVLTYLSYVRLLGKDHLHYIGHTENSEVNILFRLFDQCKC